MERLTEKDWDSVSGSIFDAVRRLQEIENILGDTYELDHLRELVEADKAGKCLIAPCAAGNTIWFKTYSKSATVCEGIKPHMVKEVRVYAVVDGEYSECMIPESNFGKSAFLSEHDALSKEE